MREERDETDDGGGAVVLCSWVNGSECVRYIANKPCQNCRPNMKEDGITRV